MASELIVQTLKGPTSGANANKILLGSGQTLIGGSGQVLKVQHKRWSDETTNSSTSYADATGSSFSYTPVSSNSSLLITTSLSVYSTDGDGNGTGVVTSLLVDSTPQDLPGDGYENFFVFDNSTACSIYLREHKEYLVSNTVTSARDIKVQFRKYSSNDSEARINRGGLFYSSITVMEIAG